MSLAMGSEPPWGLVEWLVTGLSTSVLGACAFIWRLATRVERDHAAIDWQRKALDEVKQGSEAAILRVFERLTQMHEEYCHLREVVAGLPTRSDLRDAEEGLAERIEGLASRIDRALEKSGD